MPSTNKTPNYNLSQYVTGDKQTMADYNGDNSKIDAAVGSLDAAVGAHTAESSSKHIKESGSNENGTYIQFSDGTQICYNGSLPSSNNDTTGTTVTFPASFYDSSYVIKASARGIASNTAGSSYVVETQPVSSSTCRIKIMVHTPTTIIGTGNPIFEYIAIGRWK